MKTRSLAAVVLGLACTATLITRAEMPASAPAAAKSAAARAWLKKDAIDVARLIPPPPAADSPEVREEVALLEKLQQTRTPEDVARCKAEAKLTMAAFTSVMGDGFTAQNLPKLAALIDDAGTNSKAFSKTAKKHFARARPATAHAKVKPAIEDDEEFCYPSGHSTRGILFATILAELEPSKKAALLARGQEIGFDRVIAGVHYPSDVAGGRVLGQEIARLFLADEAFQKDLAEAKAEYEAFRKASANAGGR